MSVNVTVYNGESSLFFYGKGTSINTFLHAEWSIMEISVQHRSKSPYEKAGFVSD